MRRPRRTKRGPSPRARHASNCLTGRPSNRAASTVVVSTNDGKSPIVRAPSFSALACSDCRPNPEAAESASRSARDLPAWRVPPDCFLASVRESPSAFFMTLAIPRPRQPVALLVCFLIQTLGAERAEAPKSFSITDFK